MNEAIELESITTPVNELSAAKISIKKNKRLRRLHLYIEQRHKCLAYQNRKRMLYSLTWSNSFIKTFIWLDVLYSVCMAR